MKAMQKYEGKNVYVSLNTNSGKRRYTGKVVEVTYMGDDDSGFSLYMFTITDKFGAYVSFTNKDIDFIEEEKKIEDG